MKVVLSKFARSGIEAFSGCDMAAGVLAALRHYTQGEGSSGRRASDMPRFLMAPSEDRLGADLELAIDPEIRVVLEREARDSDGISVEQIANHAVLVYLADRDRASGRREARERQLTWV
jgi:hypothetical protein